MNIILGIFVCQILYFENGRKIKLVSIDFGVITSAKPLGFYPFQLINKALITM